MKWRLLIISYLERVHPLVGVNLTPNRTEAVSCEFLNLRQQISLKAHTLVGEVLV
jgi:hypothetical protein